MAAMVLENVGVDFPIYGTQRNLRTALFQRATGGLIQREGKNHERVVVKALVDVSMKLEEGDRLALIGHNGSGKSTLLKVMAGIYEPIAGRVLAEGRVTPLFDMMPGLDIEDNAYENIFTAGLLIGMSRKEIERKIPQIEEFSELGEYLSLPVRTYSSGMVTRLGFALSTALDPLEVRFPLAGHRGTLNLGMNHFNEMDSLFRRLQALARTNDIAAFQ